MYGPVLERRYYNIITTDTGFYNKHRGQGLNKEHRIIITCEYPVHLLQVVEVVEAERDHHRAQT